MWAIYKKEIQTLFTTLEAYVAISIFFISNSLILWNIPSNFNIFYNNQASLNPFFSTAPLILLLLMPAITMKLINSEITQKTNLILLTKPIKLWELVIAKFLAAFSVGVIAIIPSVVFVYSIYQLSSPKGNIDIGEILGSYIGLLLLSATYVSIGIFCSSVSKNNMIAFISTILMILLLYFGLDLISQVYNITILDHISIKTHYESISRGIIDSRDIIYLCSLIVLFLYFTVIKLNSSK